MNKKLAGLTGLILASMTTLMNGCATKGENIGNPYHPEMYRFIHRRVWRDGGVCRHAATAVYNKAREYHLPAKILRFKTGQIDKSGRTMLHAIPAIKLNDYWYVIESTNRGDWWYSRSRKTRDLNKHPDWFEDIALGRKLTVEYDIASIPLIQRWSRELNALNK